MEENQPPASILVPDAFHTGAAAGFLGIQCSAVSLPLTHMCRWSDKIYTLVMQICMGKAVFGGRPVSASVINKQQHPPDALLLNTYSSHLASDRDHF